MVNLNNNNMPIKILYVEDDEVIRKSISRVLEPMVKKIYQASNGKQALNIIQQKKIDLVITDIRMPNMDGLSLIKKIKELKLNVPVIITTAFDEVEYLKQAIELHVDKFICKPINMYNLIDNVKSMAQTIIEQREIIKKRLQLENYKKAIRLTNFVIDIDETGKILDTTESLRVYLEENLNEKFNIKNIQEIISSKIIINLMKKVLAYEVFTKEILISLKNENFTFNLTAFASMVNYDNSIKSISIILKDLTHILKEKDKIISYLYEDKITGLQNRHALVNELNKNSSLVSLILIHLDDFKKYRHTYGFKIADKMLEMVAKELKEFWPEQISRKLYKLDDATFAIVAIKDDNYNIERSKALAMSFMEHFFNFHVDIEDLVLDVSVTLGISCKEESDILIEALIALDIAKDSKQYYLCYSDLKNPKETYEKNIRTQKILKQALINDDVVPFYQPIVNQHGNIVKYESLARVRLSKKPPSFLMPNEFLEVVKDSKNYESFTKAIIRKSIRDMSEIKKDVSINISFEDISNPSLIFYIESLLKEKLDFNVTFEILESEGLQDIDKTVTFCNLVKSYGALIAIDDFGSGYANYEYLFDLPIDILKIDGSLIKKVSTYKGYLLVESIVNLAKKLDLQLVAEYVENEAIFDKLKPLGIDMFQGYCFAKPKPLEKLLKF